MTAPMHLRLSAERHAGGDVAGCVVRRARVRAVENKGEAAPSARFVVTLRRCVPTPNGVLERLVSPAMT